MEKFNTIKTNNIKMICPNCSYKLVLLSNRRKYKCALCSNLYPQKPAEDKAFREWNEKERKFDVNNLSLEDRKRKKLLQEKRVLRSFRLLFKKRKPRLNLTPEEKRKHKRESNKRWDKRNPEKVRAMKRRQTEKHRQEIYEYQKKWRRDKQREFRLNQRLTYWRNKQKKLTLELCKDEQYKLYTACFEKVLPTSLLAELLKR